MPRIVSYPVYLRISQQMLDAVDRLARLNYRTRSQQMRELVLLGIQAEAASQTTASEASSR